MPIISYILLRGKCRYCGWKIPILYPIVEITGGLIPIISHSISGNWLDTIRISFFLFLLLMLSIIDFQHLILPDKLTYLGLVAGILFSYPSESITLKEAVFASFIGALGFFTVRWIYERMKNIEGLGLGDVKLMAMIGSFVGIEGIVATTIFGSVLGIVYSLIYMLKTGTFSRKLLIPFGPFLSMGSFLYLILLTNR